MFSDIRNDKNIDRKWRLIATICYYSCMITFFLRVFTRTDNVTFDYTLWGKLSNYIMGLFLIVGLILSSVHYFKPNLFAKNKA